MLVLALFMQQGAASGDEPGALFSDRAESSGLRFFYYNGMSREFYFVENVGGGAALLDYDNDGDLDVYLTQGTLLGKDKTWADAVFPPAPGELLSDRLFRNDTIVGGDGSRSLRFTDVTASSGIDLSDYGMGVTAGDYDNDGWVDLYVCNFGSNRLLRNLGDGRFEDVSDKAGVASVGWSVGAAFLDYDRDGFLDLYVSNYVDYNLADSKVCYAPTSARDYCAPNLYQPLRDRLLRNRGDGTFEDVSQRAGITRDAGPGLGVVAADYNGDGWIDIYVTNDGAANFLWINQRDGTFRNEALMAGVAVNIEGAAEASMGVDAEDFDGDGDIDLFMTHLMGETNTVYVNNGDGWFDDRSMASGLGAPSKAYTAFGTAWIDYDNDGWLDVFVANGDVRIVPVLAEAGDKYPLHQPNQLFRNLEGRRFVEVTSEAGRAFQLSEVSRGAAVGDIDNDGDSDVLIVNNNGYARLLTNNLGNRNHWLGLRVVDRNHRDALGARVEVILPDGRVLSRRVRADASYASASDPRVLVGLGETDGRVAVRVHWPRGEVEVWNELQPDRYYQLDEGRGREEQL